MNFFEILFSNKLLNAAILAWFTAQVIKVILVLVTTRKVDFSRFIGAGGMPSSHSALVCTLAAGICRTSGFSSPLFALAVVVALVVMYDASGVRRAAGKQAKILNILVDHWDDQDSRLRDAKLKELLGHTPLEVFAGALLGILFGCLMPM